MLSTFRCKISKNKLTTGSIPFTGLFLPIILNSCQTVNALSQPLGTSGNQNVIKVNYKKKKNSIIYSYIYKIKAHLQLRSSHLSALQPPLPAGSLCCWLLRRAWRWERCPSGGQGTGYHSWQSPRNPRGCFRTSAEIWPIETTKEKRVPQRSTDTCRETISCYTDFSLDLETFSLLKIIIKTPLSPNSFQGKFTMNSARSTALCALIYQHFLTNFLVGRFSKLKVAESQKFREKY